MVLVKVCPQSGNRLTSIWVRWPTILINLTFSALFLHLQKETGDYHLENGSKRNGSMNLINVHHHQDLSSTLWKALLPNTVYWTALWKLWRFKKENAFGSIHYRFIITCCSPLSRPGEAKKVELCTITKLIKTDKSPRNPVCILMYKRAA